MNRKTRALLICLFTTVLLFSLWKLWGLLGSYQEGQNQYEALEHYVIIPENSNNPESVFSSDSDTSETKPLEDETIIEIEEIDLSPWPQVDFDRLREINPDIVGWIFIDGTKINYPIVQSADNQYYLNRLFDGSRNAAGCIFLDYRSASDFSDQHSIIYGHHMKNRTMFADLVKYKKQAFYDTHPVALLVTPTAYYKIQFYSGYVTSTWSDAWDLEFDESGFSGWLSDLQNKSRFKSPFAPNETDRIITLATCTYEYDTAKFVVHGYISETVNKTSVGS